MNDVLVPLCHAYQANLITGLGEMSITACHNFLGRRHLGKPARIFYISDFDPGGRSMPVAVARKLEWFFRTRNLGREASDPSAQRQDRYRYRPAPQS
jgi:hypothetical protein